MPKKKMSKEPEETKVQNFDKSPSPESNTTSAILNRLSQQFNLLSILIIALFLVQVYTFYRLNQLETKGVAVAGGTGGTATESPLSQDSLVAYAEELDLNKKEFEQCLEKEEVAQTVQSDLEQAQSLGVQGTPGFFINGKFLGGAFPFETFKEIIDAELAGTGSTDCTAYSEELQQYCTGENPSFKPAPVEVAVGKSPSIGPNDAEVTIVEFSDFECPFCSRAVPTINQIKEAYPNDVKIVYKHLPLTQIHPNAEPAARASVCAQEQGKFWEYHDKLFQSQGA